MPEARFRVGKTRLPGRKSANRSILAARFVYVARRYLNWCNCCIPPAHRAEMVFPELDTGFGCSSPELPERFSKRLGQRFCWLVVSGRKCQRNRVGYRQIPVPSPKSWIELDSQSTSIIWSDVAGEAFSTGCKTNKLLHFHLSIGRWFSVWETWNGSVFSSCSGSVAI